MPRLRMSHYYKDHPPGSIVEVSDAEAERIVAGRGGKLVSGEVVETATDRPVVETRDEPALEEPDETPVPEPARKPRRGKA
jgi:hypothetical protein